MTWIGLLWVVSEARFCRKPVAYFTFRWETKGHNSISCSKQTWHCLYADYRKVRKEHEGSDTAIVPSLFKVSLHYVFSMHQLCINRDNFSWSFSFQRGRELRRRSGTERSEVTACEKLKAQNPTDGWRCTRSWARRVTLITSEDLLWCEITDKMEQLFNKYRTLNPFVLTWGNACLKYFRCNNTPFTAKVRCSFWMRFFKNLPLQFFLAFITSPVFNRRELTTLWIRRWHWLFNIQT